MKASLRRMSVIFSKDLRDAIRDARVLMAVLLPLGIGVLYNTIIDDTTPTPEATVTWFSPDATNLPQTVSSFVGEAVDLTFQPASSEEDVRTRVGSGAADIGFILTSDFDTRVAKGEIPEIEIVVLEDTVIGADYALTALDPALRSLAGQSFPADLQVSVAEITGDQTAIEQLGARDYTVLFSVVLMIVMIGMLAIPIILTEESEKKTLDALILVSSNREVLGAKAGLGLAYIAATTAMLFLLIQRFPDQVSLFAGSVLLVGVTVVGFGLAVSTVLKSAAQLNTWSGIAMMPLIVPAFLVGIGLSDRVEQIAGLTPTGAGMNLLIDSWSGEQVSGATGLSLAVIAVWGVAAYGLTLSLLRRRYR